MKGVLLLAHGTPESLDQMPEYLTLVRGGRPPSTELIAEMRRNYEAIGGRSPLTDITRAQAAALRDALADGTPVYVGMRNWQPFVAEVLKDAAREGVTEIVALPLAPQYSSISVGKYRKAVEKALPEGMTVRFASLWFNHATLLEAFAEKLRDAVRKETPDAVIFTAHSVPVALVQDGDPYVSQVAATARGVAERAGVSEYRQAWQSAGRTPEPWLGPSLDEALKVLAVARAKRALVVPVGFVSDHTEILFDIDVQARAAALEKGILLSRTESLNTSPTFVRALVEIVRG